MQEHIYIKLQKFTEDKNIQITEYGIKASSIDIDLIPSHEKPNQIRDEIPTLNRFGYMKFEWDEFCKEFVDYAKVNGGPVLEIGPAYGWVTHKALEQDITVIAADISKQHLEVLIKDAPSDKLDKLYVYHGFFPDEIELPRESLSAVLASRILHFLEGEDIEKGLDKIHSWLKPNGKFFCSNCSIHHYSVNEKMLNIYKERKSKGDKWPGLIRNQRELAPEHAPYVEDLFHPFDIEIFENILPKHGFKIEKIKLFDYPSDIYSNNIGHIGFIATKI